MRGNQDNIVNRLFTSFTDLEVAIESAKNTLNSRGTVPEEVLQRLNSYDSILAKQRRLATSLCDHIHSENWDEVNRLVGLINGLSSMIRDDAKSILSCLSLNSDETPSESDKYLC
jgi:hypothetical protein